MFQLAVPAPTEGLAAYFVILIAWWAHAMQRHRLGDDPGDTPLNPAPGRGALPAAIVAIVSLHGAMLHGWLTGRGIDGRLLAGEIGGLALVAGGAALRAWAIRTLGRLFTFELGLRRDHALVDRGPYAVVRHPGYAGSLLIVAGAGLFFGIWWAGVGYLALVGAFFLRRMPHEDRMLRAHFGASFERYAARRKRLLPGMY